jgi:hypothetical protein
MSEADQRAMQEMMLELDMKNTQKLFTTVNQAAFNECVNSFRGRSVAKKPVPEGGHPTPTKMLQCHVAATSSRASLCMCLLFLLLCAGRLRRARRSASKTWCRNISHISNAPMHVSVRRRRHRIATAPYG